MMEPIEWHPRAQAESAAQGLGACGRRDRDHHNVINSLYMDPEECDRHNLHLEEKYAQIQANETRWEAVHCDDAEIVITAYGTPARIALTALETLRAEASRSASSAPSPCGPSRRRPFTSWPAPPTSGRSWMWR